jgi:uncharacterized protein (UPF0147 family)
MKDEQEILNMIEQINKQIDMILNDSSVPRNVKSAVSDAKTALNKQADDQIVRISTAIYAIDSISTDINLQPQARTVIWNVLSMLEAIKGE